MRTATAQPLLLLCLAFAPWALMAASALDPLRLVAGTQAASHALSYRGDFLLRSGDRLDSLRIIHSAAPGFESERLVSLSGPLREVVREGTRVTCTFSDEAATLMERRQPRDYVTLTLSSPIEELTRHYEFITRADDRIAGRPAHVLEVRPRDTDRYSHLLWIDEASNLLLRSATRDPHGQVLEEMMYTALEVDAQIDPAELRSTLPGKGFTWDLADKLQPSSVQALDTSVDVGWLPPGFARREHHTQQHGTGRQPLGHIVYSDGLAMVAVFVEQVSPGDNPFQGYSTHGAVSAHTYTRGAHQVTVVGEIPPATLRRIATSIAIR